MIGQNRLKDHLEHLINDNKLPRFMILSGAKGSGKHLMVEWLYKKLNSVKYEVNINIDSIRAMQDLSYKAHQRILFTIFDADNMSTQAQNSLLKCTEEPPNDIYVIITVENINSLLPTLLNRAETYQTDSYSPSELGEYSEKYSAGLDGTRQIYEDICSTPNDVDVLYEYGVKDFCDYVQLVIDKVATVSGANSFKIADKVALKNESDKYDLKLFWKCFNRLLYANKQTSAIRITQKYLNDLRYNKLNKQMLFDMWILDIREVWRYE